MCKRGLWKIAQQGFLGFLLSGVIFGLIVLNSNRGNVIREQQESSSPREAALATLSLMPDEVRGIKEKGQRLELMIRIAEVLGQQDPELARILLLQTFDETFKREDEDKAEKMPTDEANALRRRIISLIAKDDRELAKSLLDRLDRQTDASEKISASDSSYVQFARGLAETHPDLAGYMVKKRRQSFLSWEGLLFLLDLQRREKSRADSLFLDLTAHVANQGARDVNELLMLYAYAFLPPLPLELTQSGLRALSLPGYRSGTVDSQLAVQFLRMVIPPLLAPERYTGPGPLWGPQGDFLFLTLILPQSLRFLSTFADELELQRDLLAARISARERSHLESAVQQTLSPPAPQQESVGSFLEKAESATNQKVRNRFLFLALNLAVKKGDLEHAFKIAEKFAPEQREEILSFLNYLAAETALEAGNLANALEYARRPMKPSLRTYLLAVIAYHRFRSGDQGEAVRLLGEAEQLARKLEPDRVKASLLLGISAAYGLMNEPAAFPALQEAVEAINKAKDFQGEMSVWNVITVGDFSFAYEINGEAFHFDRTFSLLGARDFHGTMVSVRSLADPVLRARAAISTCEGVLRR